MKPEKQNPHTSLLVAFGKKSIAGKNECYWKVVFNLHLHVLVLG